jgi:hypothetical protein
MVLDHLIDEEEELGWERARKIGNEDASGDGTMYSAFKDIAEYRNVQQCGTNVINTAKALKGALITQHRIEGMPIDNSNGGHSFNGIPTDA